MLAEGEGEESGRSRECGGVKVESDEFSSSSGREVKETTGKERGKVTELEERLPALYELVSKEGTPYLPHTYTKVRSTTPYTSYKDKGESPRRPRLRLPAPPTSPSVHPTLAAWVTF